MPPDPPGVRPGVRHGGGSPGTGYSPSMSERDDRDEAGYRASVEAQRADRDARLRDPLSWLSLVGLHWLRPGRQAFGAAASNDIVLEAGAGDVPPIAGVIEVVDGRVLVHPGEHVGALAIDGAPVTQGTELVDDRDGSPTLIELGSLRLHVIRRGHDRLALR